MRSDRSPRRRPPRSLPLLCLLACLALGAVASAEIPDASAVPEDAYVGDADRGLVECPADKIRARRELAASKVRAGREAVDVAKITLSEAMGIAGSEYARLRQEWELAAIGRAVAGLEERAQALRDRDPELEEPSPDALSGEVCRAMAARDAGACAGIEEASERGPCEAWLALWNATREGAAGCAKAPRALRATCRAVLGAGAEACAKGPAGEGCRAALTALEATERHCGVDLDVSRCGWSLLGLALRDGREACEGAAPGPGRQTPAHQRTHGLCLAVATGAAERCPDRPPEVGRVVPHWVEARVLPTLEGPRVFVALASGSTGPCYLELRSAPDHKGLPGAAPWALTSTVAQGSWAPAIYQFRLPPAVDPSRGGVQATASCLPGFTW